MSDKKCQFPGCTNKLKAAGLCSTHYKQKLKHGKPGSTLTKNKGSVCKIEGCTNNAHSLGMCRSHYVQNYRHGDPNIFITKRQSGPCVVCGEKPARKKGMCQNCYYKNRVTQNKDFAERMSARNHRRRAAKNSVKSEQYTKSEVIEKYGACCSLCGEEINLELKYPNPKSFTMDHVKPISKGGDNVLENIRPAHFGCNSSKRDKLEEI